MRTGVVSVRTNIIKIVSGSPVSQFANLGYALESKIEDFGPLKPLKETWIKYKLDNVKE